MANYSALFVQRRVTANNGSPVWEASAPPIRIARIVDLHTTQAIPGGWQEGDFTIPLDHARVSPEAISFPTTVWVYDGLSVAFYGHVVKAIPTETGEIQVTCDGAYRRLDDTRMREVWADADLTQLTAAPDNAKSGNMTVDGGGDLTLTLPSGSSWSAGDYCAADYFLFGEGVATRDGKKLNGWDVTIGGHWTNNANLEARIYGLSDPNDASPTLLQSFTANGSRKETADSQHGGDNTSAWPSSSGYRCFRVGLYATAGIGGSSGVSQDLTLRVSEFNVTRRAVTPNRIDQVFTTSMIAQDLFRAAGNTFDTFHLLQEENLSTTGAMVAGNIANSQVAADGIAFTDWVAPREMIEAMAAIDGFRIGMFTPTKSPPAGSFYGSTSMNAWMRQPAELVYEAWSLLSDPDYVIRLERGAVWEPDNQPDQLLSATYANYTTRRGRTVSVYVDDPTVENELFLQGWHVGVDWTIDPAVRTPTARNLAGQYNAHARLPVLAGTLTVTGDRPGSIELGGGARLAKLSLLRPGVVRIVDAPGAKAGRVEQIEYTARGASGPETAVLTVNAPDAAKLNRHLARIAARDAHTRQR